MRNYGPNPTPTPGVPPDGFPSWGSTIAVSPLGDTVWVVNPDAGSVTKVSTAGLDKLAEISLGGEPWALDISPDGRQVFVVDREGGSLVMIDAQSNAVRARLPVGPEPGSIALSPTDSKAYVTITSAGEVAVVDTGRYGVIDRIEVEPKPYAIAISDDGDREEGDEQVYVTHFLALPQSGEGSDDPRVGRVTVIDPGSNAVVNQISLQPDEHGFPNQLASIAITDTRAWVPQVRAAPELPNGLTTMVFAAVSSLDLAQGSEDPLAFLPLNDQEIFGSPVNNPLAAVPSPDGKTLYIVLGGSNLVEVVDVSDPHQPRLVKFLPAGGNPRGMALSRDGRWGYVMNYLSRSVTVLDLENLAWSAEIAVTAETLEADVLQGKILFNLAADRRLSQGSWISCASCHPDAASEGVTWFVSDGPRQTPALWTAGGTGPWHWSATFDELQDVESTIQVVQHGLGLAPGQDPPLLGSPIGGTSADLDGLAAYLRRGLRAPHPTPAEGDVQAGRSLFISTGCAACHGGPAWTSSALPGPAGTLDPDGNEMVDSVLRDVGTLNPDDVRGQTGFDSPSLLGIGLTAPYLHDGSRPSQEALLASGHPDPQGGGNGLNEAEIAVLAAFLRSIGPDTPPIEAK